MTKNIFLFTFANLRRGFWILFLVAVITTYSTPGQTDSDIEKLRAKAFKLVDEQKLVEALPLLERLSIERPDDARVFFHLGFALIAQANVTQSEEQKKVLLLQARKAFIRSKELEIDEPVVDSLIRSMPEDGSIGVEISLNKEAEKALNEGQASFSRGELDDALRSYEKALKLDPKLYEAALFAGNVLLSQNKFDRAEAAFQRAILIDPNRETAYRYSATPLMKQKKYDEARDRYIEAYITEPYNSFAAGGLTQWSQLTGIALGHPEIEIPDKIEVDAGGDVKVDLGPDVMLGGKDTGKFFWTLYGPARSKWRKGAFLKTYPTEKEYRHSLAEELDALRAVLTAVKTNKSVKKLDPSLEKLIKLDEQGLLESYILLARSDREIAADHPAYLKSNRDKLRRYVREYVIAPTDAGTSGKADGESGENRSTSRIQIDYNSAENSTSVKVPLEPITCVLPAGCIFYSLETSFEGRTASGKLGRTLFALIVFTKSFKATGDLPLLLKVDGKVHDLGPMQFAGEESRDGLRGLIFGTTLKEDELAAIAGAKNVEVKLGSLEFPLVTPNLRTISEFYRAAKGTK